MRVIVFRRGDDGMQRYSEITPEELVERMVAKLDQINMYWRDEVGPDDLSRALVAALNQTQGSPDA